MVQSIRVKQADIFLADAEIIIDKLEQLLIATCPEANFKVYLNECSGLNENYHLANNIVVRYYNNSIDVAKLKIFIIDALDDICSKMPRKYKLNKSFDLQNYNRQFDNYEQIWANICAARAAGKYDEIHIEIEKLGREKFNITREQYNNIFQQYEREIFAAHNDLISKLQSAFQNIEFTEIESKLRNLGDDATTSDGKSKLFGDTRLQSALYLYYTIKDNEIFTKAKLESVANNISYVIAGNRRLFSVDSFAKHDGNAYFISFYENTSIISYFI